MKRLALLVFFLPALAASSQVKDKNWLLIDSVRYDSISPSYRPMIDSILTLYHKAATDSDRLELVMHLAENVEQTAVWTRYNRLAYQIAAKAGDQRVYLRYKANALGNMGYDEQEKGNLQGAIGYYSESLKIREAIQDKHGIANSLNNLGYIYDELQDLAKAEEYYKESLKIREELGDTKGIVNCSNNLGAIYYFRKDYKTALLYHERSLKLSKKINYKRGIGYAYNNLGNIYREMGDLKKALEYQELALPFRIEINDEAGLSGTYYNFATIYEELNNYKKAEEYALMAYAVGKRAQHGEKTREAAYLLYEIYSHEKKFEKALDMHVIYSRMKDSIRSEASRKASIRQEYKYEFEKKESLMRSEQERKNAVADAERRRQELFLYLVIAIAVGVGIVALVVIRSLRITRRQKKIIERQKHIVEEKQKEILDSIHYAKRIQRSLLPSERYIERTFIKLRK